MGREHRATALRGARALRSVAVFLAVFAFAALAGASFHVVETLEGPWRGVLDAPHAGRLALAAVIASLGVTLERVRPSLCGPLLALGLAAAPLVPVSTGSLLPLLVFQGATLGLVLAAAAAVAIVEAVPRPAAPWSALSPFLLCLALLGALSMRLPGPAGAQGDEPHYLTMAESLKSDLDLDLRDEFRQRAYRAFYPGELRAHTSPASPKRKLYAIHTPGLPALILPAYAMGGAPGARAFMMVLTALAATLVFTLVRDVLRDESAAVAAFAAFVCLAPVALHANLIYPEVPAALATAAFLHASRRESGPIVLGAAGAAAGSLVWIHPKFLPLAATGLGLTLLRRGSPVPWRAIAALLFTGGVVSLLSWMNATYGQPSLGAAYGPGAADDLRIAHLWRGLPGLFLDREFGLLLHAPLWALAAYGLHPLWRTRAGDAMRALLLAASVVLVGASYSMWWGGASPPGRFLVPAMPALALLLAAALRRFPRAAAALFGLGLGVTVLAAAAPRTVHNRADGQSALLRVLAPAVRLDRALPSLVGDGEWDPLAAGRLEPRASALNALLAWDGTNVSSASGRLSPDVLVVPLLDDAPWRLAFEETRVTPRVRLPAGVYGLRVRGSLDHEVAGRAIRVVATLDERDAARAFLGVGEPEALLTLEVPAGGRRLEIWATGLQDGGVLEGVELRPLRVVPRGQR